MNPVSLTLTFDSLEAVSQFLGSRADPRQAAIAFADRPDTGVSADEKAAVLTPLPMPDLAREFNPFAAAEVAVAPVPPAPPAPSTAVAAALPTAPEAPPVTSVPPPVAGVPPAPMPVPAAPAPEAPAAPASPAGIEVDADGLPWDARIHAGGRAQNADGRWRQKRGLNDPALKVRVEAELRQAMGAPAASVPAPLPIVPPVPTATETPAIPPPPTVPSASTVGEPFPVFMARVGSMLVNGKLAQEQLNALLAECGLTSPAQLGVRPDLIPALAARIDAVAA